MAIIETKRGLRKVIEFRQVCAGYQGIEVLHDINLTLERGKVTIIIGPNGCGKSTLLKSLIRLNPHCSGEILVNGTKIEQYSSIKLAREIAYLPQNRNIPEITVLKMVLHGRFPYLSYPRRYRKEDIEKAREALRWAGIEELAEKNMSSLSGGTRQKVYIAMAIAQDTPVILMDEPTSFLDIDHQLRLMELAKELARKGKAVVLVLHDLSLAMRVADVMVVMKEGKILQIGSPKQLYQNKGLETAFDINVTQVDTMYGVQYFFTAKEEGKKTKS